MPEDRFDLRELARSALADMPEPARAAFMAYILIELRGPQALELLSQVRTAINLRMQELINEKLPLDDLAAIYGGPAAVHARVCSVRADGDDAEAVGFFDLEGVRRAAAFVRRRRIRSAALIRQRRVVQCCANSTDQKLNLEGDIAVPTEDRITKMRLGLSDGFFGDPGREVICTRNVRGGHDF